MEATPKEVIVYETPEGRFPFEEWLDSLRDPKTENKIVKRIERIKLGAEILGKLSEINIMPKGIKFDTYLVKKFLQDPERAKGYLREALEEGDLELLQMSVENLIKAGYSSFKIISNKSSKEPENDSCFDAVEIDLMEKAVKPKVEV